MSRPISRAEFYPLFHWQNCGTDYDVEGVAGLGVAEAAIALMQINGEKINEASFAIQGVGQ